MKKNKNISINTLIISALLFITGCGGGGGGSSVIQQVVTTPTALSGSAVDGYISGATICLDANINGSCDNGEPTTTSNNSGTYNLSDLTLQFDTLIPIIAKGGIDTATGNAYEGELKTIINTNTVKSTTAIYITPLTDLYASSYLQNTTKNETTLNTIKTNIANSLGISEDKLEANPLNDLETYAIAQQIEQFKKLVKISIKKSLNQELSESNHKNISEAIAQEIQDSSSFNIANILTKIEAYLFTPIPNNEKTFIIDQTNEIINTLTNLKNNNNISNVNLNYIQNSLENELKDAELKIYEAKTTDTIDSINISDPLVLQSNGSSLNSNTVPNFITTINTITVNENSTVQTIVEANDQNNDTIIYSLGGVDKDYFTIDSSNGTITSTQTFDYETPVDYGNNNSYNLIIIESDNKEKAFFDLEIKISNVNETTTSPLQIDGFAVDGYISGATVCLDTNMNGLCDTDESSTITLNNGSFSFNNITFELNKLIPVIVKNGVDTATINPNENELKTIINSTSLNSTNTIYVSPITDLYVTHFLQSTTQNETTLNSFKQKLANTLGLSINDIENSTLSNELIFEKSIEIQSILYIIKDVSKTNLNRELTSDEITKIKESITKEIDENESLDMTRIITEVEIQLGLELSDFEKNFVIEQTKEVKSTTDNISVKLASDSSKFSDFKNALFAELQDIIVILKTINLKTATVNTNTKLISSDFDDNNVDFTSKNLLDISSIEDLLTKAVSIKDNHPPLFTISGNTVSDVENKEFKYLITSTDEDDDTVTYRVIGKDKQYFSINSENNVTSTNIPNTYFDFEDPLDSDENNIYNIIIEASDSKEKSYFEFDIQITDLDENAPVFNIKNVIEIEEQQDYVVKADTFDENKVNYYLSDADDGLTFSIDADTGIIKFKTTTSNGVVEGLPDIDEDKRLFVINIYAEDLADNVTEHILNIRIKQKPSTAIIDGVNLLDDYAVNGDTFYVAKDSTGADLCRTRFARGTLNTDTNTITVDPDANPLTYINTNTTLERFVQRAGEKNGAGTLSTPTQSISNIGTAGNTGTVSICIEAFQAKIPGTYPVALIAYTKDLTTNLIYENRKMYKFVVVE